MWQNQPLGVLCVDNPGEATFNSDDLRLLMTSAHFLALALANQNLQEELRRESSIKANLLRQFPPQMAEQLLAHGKPQLSGERSEVTILSCDIRGFSQLTQHMQPIDVMEMLNDYFSRLTPINKAVSDAYPTYARAQTWMGASYHKLRRYDEAIKAYKWAIALAPSTIDAERAERGLREIGG